MTTEETKPEGIGRLMLWCISHGGNPRWYDHPSRFYINIDVSVKKNLYQQAHRYGVGLREEIDLLVEREYLPVWAKEEGGEQASWDSIASTILQAKVSTPNG